MIISWSSFHDRRHAGLCVMYKFVRSERERYVTRCRWFIIVWTLAIILWEESCWSVTMPKFCSFSIYQHFQFAFQLSSDHPGITPIAGPNYCIDLLLICLILIMHDTFVLDLSQTSIVSQKLCEDIQAPEYCIKWSYTSYTQELLRSFSKKWKVR